MKGYVAPITAGMKHKFFESLNDALTQASISDTLLTSGFAYATLGGVQQFIEHVETNANWRPIPKRFVIGIHHGITEPSALELLRGVPKSAIRIYIPGKRLTADALIATPLFHPKVIALSNTSLTALRFLQAGSANLTWSAIGTKPRNYEMTVAIEADSGTTLGSSNAYGKWWSGIWAKSQVVDGAIIRRYADIRLRVFDRNPILRQTVGPPANIGSAEYFFLEVGAASGPPGQRHQVEFPESLVAFFGKPVRHRRDLTLVKGVLTWSGRPLSHKITTYGVDIWRLGMPTQTTGGDPIANQVIRFRRTNKREQFDFEIVAPNNPAFTKWQRDANTLGQLGATHGQRPRIYGFY
jgi:hypothetical protein